MAAVLLYFYTAFVILGLLLCPGSKAQSILCPKNCSCLGQLVDCSDKDLTELPRDIPAWTEMLDLNSNRISTLPPDAFVGLTNLKQLDLSYNLLSTLNASIFENLKGLTELKINWNSLTSMPDFGGRLHNLTVLELYHNTITAIPSTSFAGLSSLKILDLSYNKISELKENTFPTSNTLLHLFLNNNELSLLEPEFFTNLTSLEVLNLNKNKISLLEKNNFFFMEKLKILEMSRNKLKEIEGLTFQGLKNLQVLHLKRNRISELMDGAFYGLNNIENLGLDHNNIPEVTGGWLYGLENLQDLTLSHNKITTMDDGWEFCKKLKDLNLSFNSISSIGASVFLDLNSLYYLYLDGNQITTIEDEAFKGLTALQTLELNDNELSWNIEDTTGTFIGLESLTKLGLRNNKIRSIQKKAFIGLDQLESLNLSGNKLTSIQKDSFGDTPHLKNLVINTSNCLCDCQLSWFPTWVVNKGFENSVEVQCSHPQELKGKSILEVVDTAFKCDDVPKPQIISQPRPTVALKGDNVTLVCIAKSSSKSTMSISWRKNNRDFVREEGIQANWDIETFANTPDGSVVEITSILKLKSVGDSDEGKYQCIVSNQFGSAYSSKAKLSVYVFPVFTKMPQDITVKAGSKSQARLECAAKGHPEPEIAWVKDGGTDFPAAKERRMRMMPSDDVFFIMDVQAADMGLYTCTAQNLAGNITANATLTVLETPSFQERMKDVEVVQGDNAVLKCPANGYPKPKITWTKDDGELNITPRHFFTSENELLVIVDTEAGDAGKYTCEISNTLGTERQSATLRVISSPGAAKSKKKGLPFDSDSTTTGIIIIAVVCCVVGTSLVWVIIIYQTRKQREEFNGANTDETTLPPDLPSSTYNTSSQGTLHAESSIHSSPAIIPLPGSSISGCTDNFSSDSESDSLRYDGSVGNTSKLQSRMRTAAIFPSDTESEAQTVPLTSDVQAPAENSGSSTITIPMPSPLMQRRTPGMCNSSFSRGQMPAYSHHTHPAAQRQIVCVPVNHAPPLQSVKMTPNISEHSHNQVEYPGHESMDNAVVTHPYPREEHVVTHPYPREEPVFTHPYPREEPVTHPYTREDAISPEILDKTIRELFQQPEPPGCDSGLDLSTDIARNHQPSYSSASLQRLPRFPKDFDTEGQTFPITSASPHLVPSTSPVSHHAPVHTYHSPMDSADCIGSMSPHRVLPHRTIDTYLRDPRSTSVSHRLHQDSPSSV